MFKKDSMITGIIIGIGVMVIGYVTFHYLNIWISRYFFNKAPIFRHNTIEVLSIFLAVFPFRYFMLKANKELIGRGILLVTFIVGIAYFFFYVDK